MSFFFFDTLKIGKIDSTALCWAACGGYTTIIQRLFDTSAEMAPCPENYDRMTPLQLAARNKQKRYYQISPGKAEINATDDYERMQALN
jgi:ankyrin repeat protein